MNPRKPSPREIKPGVRLWLTLHGEGVFGSGKWQLLDAIQQTGSLRMAAESLGISYRKAWGDLRKAERALGELLLERQRGGRAGGQSSLTPVGKKWWVEYARFQAEVEAGISRAHDRWVRRMEKQSRI